MGYAYIFSPKSVLAEAWSSLKKEAQQTLGATAIAARVHMKCHDMLSSIMRMVCHGDVMTILQNTAVVSVMDHPMATPLGSFVAVP